ncbi:MAG: hydantoinase B/oxoprolinase family protein, partial [Dehalococcoidia bacterium]|nr:hydantoinase B/oxoprolinase family protein [Dehalococcoidia bacterium]
MADRNGSTGVFTPQGGGAATFNGEVLDVSAVIRAASSGIRRITLSDSAMIAPAAANMARQRGIVLERAKPTPASPPPAPSAPASASTTTPAPTAGTDNGAKSNGATAVPYVPPLKPPTVLDTPTGRRNASPVLPKPLEERRPDNYPTTVFRTPRNAPTLTDRPVMTPAADTGPQGPMMFSQAGTITIPTATPATPNGSNGVQTPTNGAPTVVENPVTGWQTVVTNQENLVEAMLATAAPIAQPATTPTRSRWDEDTDEGELDPITIDLIENSLRSTRFEMDAVLFRTAMSP